MSKATNVAKIKEYLRKLVVRELDEQFVSALNINEQESSAENIKVFSYDTQNFDICKSAVDLFNKLIQLLNAQSKSNDEFQSTKTHIVSAAKYLDEFLGVEKEVRKLDASSAMHIKSAIELSNLFSLKLGVVGGRMKVDVSKEIGFIYMHFNQIQKRHYGSKVKDVEEVSTTATAGIDGTGTGHYDSPHAFAGKGKNRRKKIARQSGYKQVNEAKDWGDTTINYKKDTPRSLKKSNFKELDILVPKGRVSWVINTLKKEIRGIKVSHEEVDSYTKDGVIVSNFKKDDINKIMSISDHAGSLFESINEGRYHQWRRDESMTPKQKIGRSVREVRDALTELDKTIKMSVKLKTELNMSSKDYWKNTHKALTKISERLVKMANKVGNLK
tara:strand:+ start:1541 stop:2698 length:1158 start_codon:yes stop_codon:yes gene_type:complete